MHKNHKETIMDNTEFLNTVLKLLQEITEFYSAEKAGDADFYTTYVRRVFLQYAGYLKEEVNPKCSDVQKKVLEVAVLGLEKLFTQFDTNKLGTYCSPLLISESIINLSEKVKAKANQILKITAKSETENETKTENRLTKLENIVFNLKKKITELEKIVRNGKENR